MKPTPSYVFFGALSFLLLSAVTGLAQTIVYSQPEKKDFDRFRFDVIAKHKNTILVYKALYFSSPYHRNPKPATIVTVTTVTNIRNVPIRGGRRPTPPQDDFVNNSVLESAICLYDTAMQQLQEKVLP